ncbi:alpha-ketoglutarate-dependent 2,4-dichlorophenoxyacetate dioxygenase [Xylariaceae sp. FL1651]|nr:alpha-ketoglutarate-dependent 2,4-dichlorophenoxyacetate dioxygenase [Xylariaceae sp. FL1651]
MPGLVQDSPFKTFEVKELHPTFAAEVAGVDFENVSEEQFAEILAAMAKYGVCVFRNTHLTDATHVSFSQRFGALDNIKRYMAGGRKPRYDFYELFDAGNVSLEPPASSFSSSPTTSSGSVGTNGPWPLDPSSARAHANRGNGLFHADSSFNPRRASFSLLRAVQLPPPGHGGDTLFADSRTAAEELPGELSALLLTGHQGGEDAVDGDDWERNEKRKKERVGSGRSLVGVHSMAHSRKLGSPEFFADLDPSDWPMFRHPLLQRHEPSGRMNLYAGAHLHHIEDFGSGLEDKGGNGVSGKAQRPMKGREIPDSWTVVQKLNAHATQDKYVVAVQWHNPGDMVIWDNRCVLHRAGPGTFEGKYIRDLRRTTVHDDSPTAWGYNIVDTEFPAFITGGGGGGDGKGGKSGDVR